LQVKQHNGYGRAEKTQMQKIVQIHLKMKEKIKQDDAPMLGSGANRRYSLLLM